MHAAIVKLSIDPAQARAAAAAFKKDVLPRIRSAPGLASGYWVEPVDGHGAAFVIFDTEEHARQATPPRSSWDAPGVTIDEIEYRRIAASATGEVDRKKKYDTVVSSGQSALKALLTMNAGAVVVFLTFISHLWEKEGQTVSEDDTRLFVFAFGWFVAAIVLTLMSYGSIFLTNCFSSENWVKASDLTFRVTVLLGLLALLCFIGGGVTAIIAFSSVG